jgi:mono/diheme cytochrome c family protein
MNSRLVSSCLWVGVGLATGPAFAQQAGNPDAGSAFARRACAECHVVRNDPGPEHGPASFVTIANSPGMTETALYAFLQTSHRNMPNIRLEPDEIRNVVAYILSLKRQD